MDLPTRSKPLGSKIDFEEKMNVNGIIVNIRLDWWSNDRYIDVCVCVCNPSA